MGVTVAHNFIWLFHFVSLTFDTMMTLRAVPVDFASKWTELGDVCFKLIRCEHVPNTIWYKSFSDVYALCVSRPDPQSPRLYDAVTDLLKDRLEEILNEISSADVDSLLTSYNHHWDVFRRGLRDLDNLFKYLIFSTKFHI